jgi:hypothetical protein
MKLIPFVKNNIQLRKSILQVSGYGNITSHTLQRYLQDIVSLPWSAGCPIAQANRCSAYLEYVHSRSIRADKFEYFIVLASTYSESLFDDFDVVSETVSLRATIDSIFANARMRDEKILLTVKKVVEAFISSGRITKHYEALLFLWTNLVMLPSNYIVVLEDTDTDIQTVPMLIRGELSRYV